MSSTFASNSMNSVGFHDEDCQCVYNHRWLRLDRPLVSVYGLRHVVAFYSDEFLPDDQKRWLWARQLLLLAGLTLSPLKAAFAHYKPVPRHEEYPVAARDQLVPTKRPPLRVTSARLTRYYSSPSLQEELKSAPNFAGHLRLVTWGWGGDSIDFAVLNLRTGHAFTLPRVRRVSRAPRERVPVLDFQADNKLLVIRGRLDNGKPGRFYYVWSPRGLRRVATSIDDGSDANCLAKTRPASDIGTVLRHHS